MSIFRSLGKQPTCRKSLVIAGIFLFCNTARAGDYEQWVDDVLGIGKKSELIQAYAKRIESVTASASAAISVDPWSVTSNISRADNRPLETREDTARREFYSATSSLVFQDYSGAKASVGTRHSYDYKRNFRTERPNAFGSTDTIYFDEKERENTLVGSIEYDILHRKKYNAAWARAKSSSLTSQSQIESLKIQISDALKFAHGTATDLYLAYCNEQDLAQSLAVVERAIAQVEAQRQANRVSYKDYMNYLGVRHDLIQRKTNLRSTIEQRLASLQKVGDGAYELGRSALARGFKCDYDIEAYVKAGKQLAGKDAKFLESLPQVKSSRLQLEAAKLNLEAARYDRIPNVGPYIAGEWTPRADSDPESGKLTVGMQFSWSIPGTRSSYALQSAADGMRYAVLQVKLESDSVATNYRLLVERIKSLTEIFPLLKEGFNNANEILKATEAALLVNVQDSVSYSNAYTRAMDNKTAILNSWADLAKAIFEAKTLEDLSKS